MKKIFFVLTSIANLFFAVTTQGATQDFFVSSGADISDGSAATFDESALVKLSASDDSRIQSDGNWPVNGAYNEEAYLEFIFNPNLPPATKINSVILTHEYRRTSVLVKSKIKIWDGSSFNDIVIGLPATVNTDFSESTDISALVNNINQLNNLRIRFLAYRNTPVLTNRTSHDLIKISVNFGDSEDASPTPTLEPTPSLIKQPISVITPAPTPSAVPTQSSTPSATVRSTAKPPTLPANNLLPVFTRSPITPPITSLVVWPSIQATPTVTFFPLTYSKMPSITPIRTILAAAKTTLSNDLDKNLAKINTDAKSEKGWLWFSFFVGLLLLIIHFRLKQNK